MRMPMNTRTRPAALAAALALMLAAPALAAEQTKPAADTGPASMPAPMSGSRDMGQAGQFDQADSNQDGNLNRSEFQVLQRAAAAAPPSGALAGLKDKRVEDVRGMSVLNKGGTRIGKVEKLVKGRQDSQLYAVISVGGFLGIGDTELTMPLAEMGWEQGKLIAPTTASKRELKSGQDYDKMAYSEVDRELTIHHAAGMAAEPGSRTASFESVDANKDEHIDRAEFSAFESGEPPQPAGGAPMPSGGNAYERRY